MAEQDEELLLNDLCARIPYGVKGKCEIDASYDTTFDTIFQLHKFDAILEGFKKGLLFVTPLIEDEDEQEFANEEAADGIDILDFKPYLRPMSSMTDDEALEFMEMTGAEFIHANLIGVGECKPYDISDIIDWFNEHHFDHRGLINKGLAIEVTKENNPYND